ncbi:non-specific serine/threonine protein kinase [Entamoeba marina]
MNDSIFQPKTVSLVGGDINNYSIVESIGKGTYGNVFKGAIYNNYACVIKVFTCMDISLLKREVYFLEKLQYKYIVKLFDVIINPYHCLILEYIDNIPLKELSLKLTQNDIMTYMKQILLALQYTHENGIMHRDIKPSNIMFNHTKKQIKLIDWGLAEYYINHTKYSLHVSSLPYKAPEILLKIKEYSPAIDIWGVGCILSEMIICNHSLFNGVTKNDILEDIIKLKGSEVLYSFLKQTNCVIPRNLAIHLVGRKKRNYMEYATKPFMQKQTTFLLNLLDELLTFNPHARITAKEAVKLFFK